MPANFSRTCRDLEHDRLGTRSCIALIAFLIAGWSAWLVLGRVSVYQATERARVEVGTAGHPIAAVVGGCVVESRLAIGQEVSAEEVLVVLDAESERRAKEEAQTRQRSLLARHKALLEEITAVEEAVPVESMAREAAREESQARIVQAEAKAELTQLQAKMSEELRSKKAVSEWEYHRDRAEADVSRANIQSLRAAATKLDQDRALDEKERQSRVARLHRELTDLEGEAAVEEAVIHRLECAISQRVIRAPISGRLGEVAEVRPGTVVSTAEKLGTVVPHDPPRVVAFFPASSVGRVRPRQTAQIRLEGYPWMQYGTVAARVREVGNEPSGGLIRAELELQPDPTSAIPLTHGLPGNVEVEVERVSPAVLILRAAGQYLTPAKDPFPQTKDGATRTETGKGNGR